MAKEDDSIISLALKRFKVASDAEANNRKDMKADTQFCFVDQWDDNAKKIRGDRPCLTLNRLPQSTRQITNELRQNMPSVEVIPATDGTEEVAEIFNGIIRHIQESSQATVAYATANNAQVVAGLGFFRVITEYCNDKNFDKDIKIKRIKNALSVYVDPAAVEPDYSDAMYMFITSDITHDEFKHQFPGKQIVNNDELSTKGDEIRAWAAAEKDSMRIAEYFTIEEKDDKEIYRLKDGSFLDVKPKDDVEYDTRTIKKRTVKWRMISGIEILDEREWPGKYIPIIPVLGEDIDCDGKRIIKGMIRDAKDPQRMYNYWASSQAEAIALVPRAPFIMAEGQIEGYESMWADANTKNYATLIYKPQSINGTLIGPPQRNQAEPAVQAMVSAMAQAAEDIKSITGIHDASLGARSNEVSGTAIKARTMQGDIANYHYKDNFAYSLMYLGKILVDLIPKIYDAPRIVRILGEDGTSKYKKINQPSDEKDKNGIAKVFDLTIGEYEVVVDVGPSYKTKRAEDSANMSNLLTANPDLWKVIGDLAVKAMDWPDAQQIGDRLKKLLPPELQESDGNEEIPIQVKQKLDQYGKLIDQLTGTVHKLTQEKEQKIIELESKERIALEQINSQIILKTMDLEGTANHAVLAAELKGINDRLQLLNINQPMDMQPNSQSQNVDNSNSQIDNGNNNMLPSQ